MNNQAVKLRNSRADRELEVRVSEPTWAGRRCANRTSARCLLNGATYVEVAETRLGCSAPVASASFGKRRFDLHPKGWRGYNRHRGRPVSCALTAEGRGKSDPELDA